MICGRFLIGRLQLYSLIVKAELSKNVYAKVTIKSEIDSLYDVPLFGNLRRYHLLLVIARCYIIDPNPKMAGLGELFPCLNR